MDQQQQQQNQQQQHHHQQQQQQPQSKHQHATHGSKNVPHSPLQQMSYHKQQQIHQRHIQKIGGYHMLTVDLAGQLQEADQQPVSAAPTARSQLKASSRQLTPGKPKAQSEIQPQRPNTPSESPDQMELIRSDGSEVDPVEAALRDAKDTADDAAILKRYKICNLVGQGNYARVYRGIFPQNNKEVAIKSINMIRATENYKLKFLPRELSILKRVSHVNICKIYEILQSTDRVFIIMQFCSRGTIADLLQRNQGPLNESIARFLFAATNDALCYLHALDIAHRDIKIENILLDHEFAPKLTDFSYSCYLTDSHLMLAPEAKRNGVDKLPHQQKAVLRRLPQLSMRLNETFCGTLPYLSPEMIRQFPYDSRKSDIWSLGVCLYVILNDRLPFPFSDIKLMIKKQLTRDFKLRSGIDISETCRDLLLKLLEPDFARRIGAHDASRHAWLNGPRERPSDNCN